MAFRGGIIGLAGVCIMLAQGLAGGDPLVRNGSFDDGTEGWHLPGTGAAVVRVMQGKQGDVPCLLLTRGAQEPERHVASDPFPVTGGARYDLQATVELVEGTALGYKVTVEWLDGSGGHLGYANDWTGHVRGEGVQQHMKLVTAPGEAEAARILLGITAGGALRFYGVSLAMLGPSAAVEGLGMAQPLWNPAEPNEARCRVRNTGGVPLDGVKVDLFVGVKPYQAMVGRLAPGEARTVSVPVEAHPMGEERGQAGIAAFVSAESADLGYCQVRDTVAVVAEAPPEDRAVVSGEASVRYLDDGGFLRVGEVRHGDRVVGRIRGMGVVEREQGTLRGVAGGRGHVPETSEDGVRWTLERRDGVVTASIRSLGEGWFDLEATFTSNAAAGIRNFSLIDLFADFDGAGREKDSALFGGLEYLTAEEMSSGTESVAEDLADRYAPHPNKVTTPLMAVAKDGVALGLVWDPLQEWTPGEDRPVARFASPDRLYLSDGHYMSLAAPGLCRWRDADAAQANDYPVAKEGALTLRARLFVLPIERDVSEVVPAVYAKCLGEVALPDLDRDYGRHWRDAIEYSMGTWDAAAGGWKNEAHHEAGYHEHIAAQLLNYAVWHDDAVAAKAREQVAAAVAKRVEERGPGSLGMSVALHAGHVEANLGGLWGGLDLIESQRPDGSWAFAPDEKTASLGEEGDTASGICLVAVVRLLELAERTGSGRALAAGLKGLDYVDRTFNRPAGGETWEVPLHAPNLRASALGVDAGVLAYRLTGEAKYLDLARYWADTGLPFLYTWGAADRPGMRFATVSVFGATFYTTPWFGRPVQWVGMVYARSLDRLAAVDGARAAFWKHTAEGILLSAIAQQRLALDPAAGNPWPGAIPDSYDLMQGVVLGAWIGPQLILPSLETANEAPGVSTRLLGAPGRQLRIWSGARIAEASLEGDTVRATLAYPPERPGHLLVLCTTRPERVTVDGAPLDVVDNLDGAASGWRYDEARRVVLVKHVGGASRRIGLSPVAYAPSME